MTHFFLHVVQSQPFEADGMMRRKTRRKWVKKTSKVLELQLIGIKFKFQISFEKRLVLRAILEAI